MTLQRIDLRPIAGKPTKQHDQSNPSALPIEIRRAELDHTAWFDFSLVGGGSRPPGPSRPPVSRDAGFLQPHTGNFDRYSAALGHVSGLTIEGSVLAVVIPHQRAVAFARLSASKFTHALGVKCAPAACSCESSWIAHSWNLLRPRSGPCLTIRSRPRRHPRAQRATAHQTMNDRAV
jgi:hypothetical protein